MHKPVSCCSNHKLRFKYFGLPKCWKRWVKWHTSSKSSKFHPVVHVSIPKPAKPPKDIEAASKSLKYDQSLVSSSKPAQVLQTRLVKVGGHTRKQYKIAWSGLPTQSGQACYRSYLQLEVKISFKEGKLLRLLYLHGWYYSLVASSPLL